MALESGTRLGHYEVTDLLGKGGMGEVYRARDTKLGREVAIKVLPSEFSQDQERLARLEREARMLAALNHPNIAAIYGLEQSGDTRFLVLELVEGETLADRLRSGAIPVEDSLKLALQAAEALEAAHEKAVIHRDLKPANIKVTPDGKVKVLDFGLAKAFEGEIADVNLSNSPTLSMQATQQGVILGTAAYMSPEQARGETTDKRADVWAFGCVLFEMLTGRGTFDGKTVSDVLAGVLRADPDWMNLPANLHPRLRLLLERCLEKDPVNRYHDIADVRVDLQQVLADPDGVIVQPAGHLVEARPQSKLPWVAATFLVALLAAAVGWLAKPEPPPAVSRSEFFPDVVGFTNTVRNLAFSPDGTQFAYSTPTGLYLRSIDELEGRNIPGIEGTTGEPVFSPDGEWLIYASQQDAGFAKIPVVGGTPVTLAGLPFAARRLSWDSDDAVVYGSTDGIWRVSSDGGDPELLVSADEAGGAVGSPQLLKDGTVLLFDVGGARVGVRRLDAVEEAEILFAGVYPRYVETGHIVYKDGEVLFAVPFDIDALEVTGSPIPVVDGVQAEEFAISDVGSLIFIPSSGAADAPERILAWVDRDGSRTRLDVVPRPYRDPKISPDGTRLAVQTTDADGSDIWVYELDGQTQMQQMTGEGNNIRPIWTPDGERLTFTSDRDGTQRLYSQAADLSGTAVPLTPSEGGVIPHADSWTPDGRTLSFSKNPQPRSVWTLTLDEDGEAMEPEPFVGGVPGEDAFSSSFSPDGEWLAYLSQPSVGQEQLYVEPFPATGTQFQLTQDGGSNPLWSRDGEELFYRRGFGVLIGGGQSTLHKVDITIDPVPQFSNEQAMPIQGFVVTGSREYDITPDGERFMMVFPSDETGSVAPERPRIHIVLNWFEELKERVPVP